MRRRFLFSGFVAALSLALTGCSDLPGKPLPAPRCLGRIPSSIL